MHIAPAKIPVPSYGRVLVIRDHCGENPQCTVFRFYSRTAVSGTVQDRVSVARDVFVFSPPINDDASSFRSVLHPRN